MNEYDDNRLCEICLIYQEEDRGYITIDAYWINTHCIELRRNRESRKHKNVKPKTTVF